MMENVEATIQSVGRLGREGMRETNKRNYKDDDSWIIIKMEY